MKIAKVRDVKTPTRGTSKAAGIDFYIPNDADPEQLLIPPHGDRRILSGVHVRVPDGFALIAFNKSGIALTKKLQVGACVIDEDFQGEMSLHVFNISNNWVELNPGEKLIQFLLVPVSYEDIQMEDTIKGLYKDMDSERGTGNFGSTGLK